MRDFELEKRILRPDGDLVWVRQTVALVRARDGVAAVRGRPVPRRDGRPPRRRAPRPQACCCDDEHRAPQRRAVPRPPRPGAGADAPQRPAGRRAALHDRRRPRWRRRPRAWRRCCGPGTPSRASASTTSRCCWRRCTTTTRPQVVARRVRKALEGLDLRIGIATAGEGEGAPKQIVADAAAGARGVEESRLQRDLRRALELEELRLVFQPVVALDGRAARGPGGAAALGRPARRAARCRASSSPPRAPPGCSSPSASGSCARAAARSRAGAPPGWRPGSRSR